MPTIPYLSGISMSGAHLAIVTANADASQVTITPMHAGAPVMKANTAPDVQVDRGLKKLLDRAGLKPPPAGQLLSIAHVNAKLADAKMSTDDRLDVKAGLVRLGMIEMGKPVDIFGTYADLL